MPLLTLLLLSLGASPDAPRTFRLDAFHTGTAREERYSLDRLVLEPLPWPGPPSRTADDTNLGKYRFEVRAVQGGALLYSRGFSSIYGEWETTDEARTVARTFHESFRFPRPAGPVHVVVQKRDARQRFRELHRFLVDPASGQVDPSSPEAPGPLLELMKNGPPAEKVDLLLLADGYTKDACRIFEGDARKRLAALFALPPFKERRADFNVWGLCPPSQESGISRPSTGIHRRSRVGATYDAFGAERYILTFENRQMRDVAAFAPYEFIVILARGATYGGGGIFNLFSTVSADSHWADYVFVHELGHHFAALADEYFTSEALYLPDAARKEPWEPNVTAAKTRAGLKWKDLVKPATPVPTPWDQKGYEAHALRVQGERKALRAAQRPEAEMDALFEAQRSWETTAFAREPHAREVGAFEGANYEARGFYRPQLDCVMFSRNAVPFCDVCQRAIGRVIDLYTP